MDPLIARIREDLSKNADPDIRAGSQRFFKEGVRCYGMKTKTATGIAKRYWKEAKTLPKAEIYALCEELFSSGYLEEAGIASNWTYALSGTYDRADLAIFRRWIDTCITTWAACDTFCNHTVGDFMEQYPECIAELRDWTQSENRWMRRAAAVSLIVPAKHGKFLAEAMAIADLLLTDADDMVQKGYGWLLKEESREHTDEIFSFVMAKKKDMPRTALRYAIELMPKELRAEVMKKDW
ncbi:DNA alkylation repair protein [Methanogenium organophilum]|uniref:DNA alkylation repair protein n=1 Tax=Methanogenium organophilum TaxID=2199 RepID=A0A9X9T8J2_METOG|nr:DNA alkylation repair protein [Methanogenium organophilum]WAI02199.1 DNA alkylation repair protein [Methanogenium organophilum]